MQNRESQIFRLELGFYEVLILEQFSSFKLITHISISPLRRCINLFIFSFPLKYMTEYQSYCFNIKS